MSVAEYHKQSFYQFVVGLGFLFVYLDDWLVLFICLFLLDRYYLALPWVLGLSCVWFLANQAMLYIDYISWSGP